jgi:flagellar biogenesis protein FliO
MIKYIIVIAVLFSLSAQAQTEGKYQKTTPVDSIELTQSEKPSISFTDSLRRAVPQKEDNFGGYLLKVIWITIVLALFIIAGLYLYKKYVLGNVAGISSSIKVITKQSISPKHSIVIVNIEDRKFALGLSDHSINVISDLGKVEVIDQPEAQENISFKHLLKKATGKS